MSGGRPRRRSAEARPGPAAGRPAAGQAASGGTASGAPAAPGGVPVVAESRIRAALWTTIPAALATELGALATIGFGALPGIAAGLAGVILLHLGLRRLAPSPALVRGSLLVGGPPLRYGLLLVAVWYEWVVRGSGPSPALAAGLVLVVVVPMIGSLLAAPRSGGGRP